MSWLVGLALFVPSVLLAAQLQTGSIHGQLRLADAGLPGATIHLTGRSAPQLQVSDDQGRFRFLGLPPGTYRLEVTLDGFSTIVHENLRVVVGRNASLALEMVPAFAETIDVTSVSPILELRKVATGDELDQNELEKIPTARDPWDTIRQVPGVLVDRVNIAGNQSSEPSTVVSPGSEMAQQAWFIDGVAINDPAVIGTPATFFDFDAFEEVQVTTGGTDVTVGTGASFNLVTRRGTNEWRGSARFLGASDGLQSGVDFDQSKLAQPGPWNLGFGQQELTESNRTNLVRDVGGEIGGPLLQDRLWLWAGIGRQDIDVLSIGDFPEESSIETFSTKLNAELDERTRVNVFFMHNDRLKTGRDVGPLRPPETAWDFPIGADILKVEATRFIGDTFDLTARVSYVDQSLETTAPGGLDVNAVILPTGVWQGSFIHGAGLRDTLGVKVDSGAFFGVGRAGSELRFGLAYRNADSTGNGSWPGVGGVVGLASAINTVGFPLAMATVGPNQSDTRDQWSLHAQETLTFDRMSVNLGLRFDAQSGRSNASSLSANELFPVLMPGVDFAGADGSFDWRALSPRIGLTYALGEARDTVVKASYARFSDELSMNDISHANPTQPNPASFFGVSQSATFVWLDDGDFRFDPSEIGPVIAIGAADPTRSDFFPNTIDPGFSPPITDEILVGVEHAIDPDFTVGATLTWRNRRDVRELNRLVFEDADGPRVDSGRPHGRQDYELAFPLEGVLPNQEPYSVPVHRLKPGLTWLGGTELSNGEREQDYLGFSLSSRKRWSNGGLLRGWVNFNSWSWRVPEGSVADPTPRVLGDLDEGGIFVQDTSDLGIFSSRFLNSQWSLGITGTKRIAPESEWGLDVAVDLYGRQGFPIPYFESVSGFQTMDAIDRQVRVSEDVADFRNESVVNLNLRVEKEIRLDEWSFSLSLDAFNLLNRSPVLQRQHQLGIPVGDYVTEGIDPRIFRVGLRVRFR